MNAYEKDVVKRFPQAMERFFNAARKLSLFPGELSISRSVDGWKAVCVAPTTVCQTVAKSIHFFSPSCVIAMQRLHAHMMIGYGRVPPAYIAVPDDPMSAAEVVRAAKTAFRDARGVYVGLLQRPKYTGVKHAFKHPIKVSAILARSTDADPELGIRPV
jgi:hypothetical protein